ncbi:MAG: hypothetical protein KF781_09030 [Chitinophagaceae bacterium]|nr:hypothetical protein [Chitinophagaceae bacterium]MCW5905041.1 hypothetical protein [Chitinophagaceae bacterium]
MRLTAFIFILFCCNTIQAQDTTIIIDKKKFTLTEVVVRNGFDYNTLLKQIKEDTSFYKAFKNLRIIGFTAYNDIKMLDKKGKIKASLFSKTKQERANNCRTMQVLEETTTGNFYDKNKNYHYTTAQMYASLFFTKGTVCNETNIVAGNTLSVADKKGMDKHKEQLKMLFFNPGKKIPGIPFIGGKLDLYDDAANKIYDYKLDLQEKENKLYYVLSIVPKNKLGIFRRDKVVVDEMITWFDPKTLEVAYRSYSLSYSAGVYDFDVSMEVQMTTYKGYTVPKLLRYIGNWDVMFKKRERSIFTATLFDFKEEEK